LVITRQGEYNNYDKSKFSSNRSAILMGDTPAERSQETMAAIKSELESAPSLGQYDYKAWDEDTRAFVNNVLRMYLNPGEDIAAVTSTPKASSTTVKTEVKTEAAPVATETPATETSTNKVTTDEDLDSFLDGLNI
jgi:hypothetical protein